jgi:cupin 2 domain-containing protein
LIAMSDVTSGRLLQPSDAPRNGERVEEIARIRNLVIEQILSGQVEPAHYLQAHDEWVLVLSGGATLDVDGDIRELRTHDWVLLQAGTPHRLITTEPGTTWLAVHRHPE